MRICHGYLHQKLKTYLGKTGESMVLFFRHLKYHHDRILFLVTNGLKSPIRVMCRRINDYDVKETNRIMTDL